MGGSVFGLFFQRLNPCYSPPEIAVEDLSKPRTYYTKNDFVQACSDGFYWKAIEILEQVIPPKVMAEEHMAAQYEQREVLFPVKVNDIGAQMQTGFFACFMGALLDDER